MKTAYKITMPILMIAIYPVLLFLPLLHLNITSSLAGSLSANLGIKEYSSLMDILKMGKGMDETQSALWKTMGNAFMDKDGTIGSVFTNTKYLYFFAVFAGLMLVLALVTAILAIVLRKYTLPTCFAAGTLVSAFAMNKSFDAFAKPLITGQISLSSFLSSDDSGNILSSLLGSLAKMESLELAVAYNITFFLLLVAVIFSVIALIVQKNAG